MFANYKINLSTLSGTNETFVTLPFNVEYQIVDTNELVEREFVNAALKNSVNPILDYDKSKFIPIINENIVSRISYNISFLVNGFIKNNTTYSDIGFNNSDIQQMKNYFTDSFLDLIYYDSANQLTQQELFRIRLYSKLNSGDTYGLGAPKPYIQGQIRPSQDIRVRFEYESPLIYRSNEVDGYFLYDYKSDYVFSSGKELYMRGVFFNGKSGRYTNLMTDNKPYYINELINKLYTKYILYRDINGYFYMVDNVYSDNVSQIIGNGASEIIINLYEIQAI